MSRSMPSVRLISDSASRISVSVLRPEEVHLQQADAIDLLHRPLGRDFVAVALEERRVVGDRPGGDDDARGVDAGVARHALEPLAHVEQVLDARILLLHLAQLRVLDQRLLERHVERRRNLLGDAIDVRVGHVHGAADVAHHGLGLHRAERDDLRDVLAAVPARDVLDDFAAPPLAEVDVDVGHRHALGIQEALEDEVVVERVDVGDPHRPGDQAAGRRAAARTDRNALLARVADEVPDDQQIAGEPHPLDHLDLVGQALLVVADRVTQLAFVVQLAQPDQALGKALARDVLEVAVDVEAFGHVELRQVDLPARNLDVDALGDAHRVAERLGMILEDLRHLGGGLQEELIAVIAQPLRVVDRLPGADAQQDVVRLEVVLPQVVHVVGADQRQVQIARDRQQPGIDDALLVDALELHLEKEVAVAEDVAIAGGGGHRALRLLAANLAGHLAFQAAAQTDQPLAVRRRADPCRCAACSRTPRCSRPTPA